MKIKTKEIALVLSFVALGCGCSQGQRPRRHRRTARNARP